MHLAVILARIASTVPCLSGPPAGDSPMLPAQFTGNSMRPSKTLLLSLLAFCFVAAGLTSCTPAPPEVRAATAKAPRSVAVVKVTRQDLSRDLELSAEFRPYQEIDLYAKLSGYLKSIYVDVGDQVRQGQRIAELEVPEMTQDVARATSSLKRYELEVERARGEVKRAENTYRIRQLSYTRLASVVKARPNLVAQQEIDDADARLQDAQAQVMTAKASLAAAEEQVGVATANKERIQTMIGYLKITAPFSGIITQRLSDPGAMIQAGTASHSQALPVVRLSQIDHLRLVLPVPESIAARVRAGTPVEVRVDSLNRIFQGRVSRFSSKLDSSTRTMETEVDLPNFDHALMPGMYGNARLRLDRRIDVLAVPVQAISSLGESPAVLVVNGHNKIEERRIALGLQTPSLYEVVAGLREGERAVIGGRGRLRAGMVVDPKPMPESTLLVAGGSK